MPKVNPDVLSWARETAGLSPDDAVGKLQLRAARGVAAVDRLAALETGADHPTRPMLAKMAKAYRRPLVALYLETPPRSVQRGTDFRTFAGGTSMPRESLVQALVRDAVARQGLVRAQLEDDEAGEVEFVGSVALSDGRRTAAATLAAVVNGAIPQAHGNARGEFDPLRDAAESRGVFVLLQGDLGSHHTDIDTDAFRGFALADPMAPFIVINDNDARTAWSFTLLHEIVHLLLGETGISGGRAETETERFCNDVASEYLMPQSAIDDFPMEHTEFDELAAAIGRIASEWNVSRALIASRLYRSLRIDIGSYQRLAVMFRRQWFQERQRRASDEGGPSYYTVRRHRTGKALLNLVRRGLGEGSLSTTKAAIVLGVKPTHVGPMLRM